MKEIDTKTNSRNYDGEHQNITKGGKKGRKVTKIKTDDNKEIKKEKERVQMKLKKIRIPQTCKKKQYWKIVKRRRERNKEKETEMQITKSLTKMKLEKSSSKRWSEDKEEREKKKN